MRILYDGYVYDTQAHGGVNRYFNEIIQRLPATDAPIISSVFAHGPHWPRHPRLSILRPYPFTRFKRLRKPWLHWRSRLSQIDLVHPTFHLMTDPGLLRRKPLVITVYDMIQELFPEQADPSGQVRHAKREGVERADAILCISENTRRDLIDRYPAAANKCHVTPLAASLPIFRADPAGLERPYFLYVGKRDGYKNFAVLLAAFRRLQTAGPDIQLRVVGGAWSNDESRYLADYKLGHQVVLEGAVDDARLGNLYRHSLALVYPSRYEGFGIPLLEAMHCGTAVICAQASSLPEVGGAAPLYFDPDKADDLLEQMQKLASSPSLRTACVEAGAERIQHFSWDRTYQATSAVYRKLVAA